MFRSLILLSFLLPVSCFGQFTVSGKVLNKADARPVPDASVFLSNATIGNKTANDGTFILHNVSPGKYDVVISIVGFETYKQSVTINSINITLPDISILPKSIVLKEVSIRPQNDPDRPQYYEWFKNEFLGTSELSNQCKILNPEILDFDYDKKTSILTASASDFLEIENAALGYRIKYVLNNFKLIRGEIETKVHYDGSAWFEEMRGSPREERRWQKKRQQAYEGSPRHFLRSVLAEPLASTRAPQPFGGGFSVLRLAKYPNPERPTDSLIDARVSYYKKLKSGGAGIQDSLSFWNKKAKMPKTIDRLLPDPLKRYEFVKPTDQKGLFALGLSRRIYSLYINYDRYYSNKFNNGHYELSIPSFDKLSDPKNTDNSLVSFNSPYALFDSNGGIVDANSLTFQGVWGRRRMAELLPLDYVAQFDDSKLDDDIILKLNNFYATHVREKPYLQFDKPFYAAGDTMYFKAYVTKGEAHLLSDLSGVLHVDLINASNKIDQSIKLNLDSGLAWGDFTLPDSLPKGNYRVRAYTQLMRNEGEKDFFNKTIPIGSISDDKILESSIRSIRSIKDKPDIQFLAEGGNIVEGIKSKIAFKAVGTDGLSIDVKGEIMDNEGKQVCTFASSHLGMGYFYLNPEMGKNYRAKVSYPNGILDTVSLPKAAAKGLVLSFNNDSISKIIVKIQANAAYYKEHKDKDFAMIVSSGGVNSKITCTLDSEQVSFDILKRRLHTGITNFTLFSPKGEVLCERLLFIKNNDQLKLHLSSNKPEYTQKENVVIKLNVTNASGGPGAGHFSVAVTDETKVHFDINDENTILTSLLLSSDLNGYVEQPNYYFTDTSLAARQNLDILMLTQGYRRFEWKKILDNSYPSPSFQPEQGLEISGTIKSLWGKPLKGGTVNLIPQAGGPVLSSVSDERGLFHFKNLVFFDTTRFVLSGVKINGKNSTKFTYSPDENLLFVNPDRPQNFSNVNDSAMAVYVNNLKNGRNADLNYRKGIMLKEVKIRERKRDDDYRTQSLAGAGFADQVMNADQIEQIQGMLVTSLNGRLHGVTFVGSPNSKPYLTNNLHGLNKSQPMLVVIDGAEVPSESINNLTPNDVETVEVLKYANTAIYGMQGANGVLIITTKQAVGDLKYVASIGVLPIAPVGFYKAREFYSPKYDNVSLANKQKDLRSTIYWKPELTTDKDGNASFEFYNADGVGNYRIVVEGIDGNGNLGRQVFRYKVQ